MGILWRIIAIQITEVQDAAEYRDTRAHFNPGDCVNFIWTFKASGNWTSFWQYVEGIQEATRDLANGAEESEETKNVKEKTHLKAVETKESKTVN